MKSKSRGDVVAANICARIREFCAARQMSLETVFEKAELSSREIRLFHAETEQITQNMIERIADVLNVHPAALMLDPNEHTIAKLLEPQRDLPKAEFQKLASELVSKGFFRSRGAA